MKHEYQREFSSAMFFWTKIPSNSSRYQLKLYGDGQSFFSTKGIKNKCLFSLSKELMSILDAMFLDLQVKSWPYLFGHTGKSSGKTLAFLVNQHLMSSGLMQSTREAA